METNNTRSPAYQTGFSLVEIMVGMVIGLLATLVIVQIMSVFESQKRTTTGSADAQTNGAIALFTIEHDLKMAGFPIMRTDQIESPFKCTTLRVGGVLDVTTAKVISPVIVTDGGGNVSDSITIRYGSSLGGGIPSKMIANAIGNNAVVASNLGCLNGDTTLISTANSSTCDMSTVNTGGLPGSALPVAVPPAPPVVALTNPSGAVTGSYLACLGAWNTITYSVDTVKNNLLQNGVPVVTGIVNLQAQYGISAGPNSNTIVNWVDASGATWGAAVLTVTDRNRIKAVRVAVVAHNPKIEPAVVTNACSSLTAAAPTGLCAWEGSAANPAPPINMAAIDANWLRFRYRVFETIIPLRNIIWAWGAL